MPLRTIVKVSHISNLSDARYCAGMGVEMLGFRVIPGAENYMSPEVFQDIRGWISGPKIIAELYGLTSQEQIDTVIRTYAPDFFELNYTEYRTCGHLLTLPCIVYFPLVAESVSVKDERKISHILVDEQTTCKDIPATRPVLINVTSEKKLNEKLAEGCFRGFVLEGPKELRPGVTNYDQLGGILEALEED